MLPAAGGASSGEGGSPAGATADFSLGKVKGDKSKGTATLVVKTPGPGTVKISGKGVRGVTAHPKQAGPVTLTVKRKAGQEPHQMT